MTKKKSEDKNTEKTTSAKKTAKDKLILFEAVQEHPAENFVIVGALSKADLLEQYRQEELDYGIADIAPSITMEELDEIVKDFLGE